MLDPLWVTAGADLVLAAENGAIMIGKRKPKDDGAQPAAPVVVQSGATSQAIIISAAILALAMLLAAGIIHHGLAA